MYSNKLGVAAYNEPMTDCPRETFGSSVNNTLQNAIERLRSVDNKLTEIAGGTNCATADAKAPNICCLTDDVMQKCSIIHGYLNDIQEKLDRIV